MRKGLRRMRRSASGSQVIAAFSVFSVKASGSSVSGCLPATLFYKPPTVECPARGEPCNILARAYGSTIPA
jgi:hypothetical protein